MSADGEKLLSAWLRDQYDVIELVDDRVYTVLPREATFPLVRLSLLADMPMYNYAIGHTKAMIQIDCYGGPKYTARQLCGVIRKLICEQLPRYTELELGTVVATEVGAMRWMPDIDFTPPKPRYVLTVTLTLRGSPDWAS